jgi:cell wall-associated NlpC family hydrolase
LKKIYTLLIALSLATVAAQAATKTVKHTIKKGETLYTIAHKNHTTIEEVRKANGLKKGDTLKIGRVLKVPKDTYFPNKKKKVAKVSKKSKSKKLAKKTTKKPTKYVIKSGDTLSGIARKHHTTIAKVRKANGLKKGQTLKLGKVLKMPKNSYVKSKKKKTFKIAKTKKSRQEKKLAKALMNIKSKKPAKAKKGKKFALEDIFYKGKGSNKSTKITKLAKKKLGRRYVWGAVGKKNTFDCSGLTSYVCKKNGICIPRTSIAQSKHGKYISRKDLQPGDLIFFDTSKRRKGYVNHVGIYLGNDRFIHASSAKKKVVITKLGKSFYSKRYKGARRVTS